MTTALGPSTAPAQALTPELIERLLAGARTGMFRSAVAESVGLRPDLLDLWLQMGFSSEATEPYRTFAVLYRASEQGAQLPYLQAWQGAATVSWQAAQAWLAARYPDQWGPKATKNTQAGSQAPTASDEAAEEQMVDALLADPPPALVRLLAKRGIKLGG